MRTGTAWNIRGVDRDTREAVLDAARQSGVSVGDWLNLVISDRDEDGGVLDHIQPAGVSADATPLSGGGREDVIPSDEEFAALIKKLRWGSKSDEPVGAPQRRQASVPEMVAELARELRELEATDETARSTIEGKRSRTGTDEAVSSEVAMALRDLDLRLVAMDERIERSSAAESNTAKLDDISTQLNSLLAHSSPPPKPPTPISEMEGVAPTPGVNATLRALETRLQVARQHMRSAKSNVEPANRRVPSAPANNPGTSQGPGALAAAIEEISRRQRDLDAGTSARSPHASHTVLADPDGSRQEMASLLDQIRSVAMAGTQGHSAAKDQHQRMDVLAAEQPERIEQLRAEIETSLDTFRQEARHDRARLDGLSEQVAALHQALHNQSDPGAVSRLEMQVADLAISVEAAVTAVAHPPADPAIQRLEGQVHEIAQRLGQVVSEAPHPEMQDQLQAEIERIRGDVAAMPKTDPAYLEGQIADLTSRIDEIGNTNTTEATLNDLDGRVSRLAAELEYNQVGQDTLSRVEGNLADVHNHLKKTEAQAIEKATAAALEAVRELSAVQEPALADTVLIADLKEDLENLRDAAGSSQQQTSSTLEAVNETVRRVAERLARLEAGTPNGDGEPVPRPVPEPVLELEPEPVIPRAAVHPTPAAPMSQPIASPPPTTTLNQTAAQTEPIGASGNGPVAGSNDDRRARRADFIAAARRAALAATSESEPTKARPTEKDSQSTPPSRPFSRIRRALKGHKRALLLAVAIIVAIGVMQVYGQIRPPQAKVALIEGSNNPPHAAQFQGVTVATAMAPSPGATEPALVAPIAAAPLNPAFSAPLLTDNRFTRQPRPLAPEGFAATAAATEFDVAVWPVDLVSAGLSGDPAAAFEIASRYDHGTHGSRDMAKARDWYGQAAGGGVAVAQYRLASLYERGEGGAKDLGKAEIWYQRAADQGNINAMHNLAVLKSQGAGGSPDAAKAVQWFINAADHGVTDSQYNLGVIYARAIGTERDLVRSYKWFAIAASAGDRGALERRDEIAKAMNSQDLERARTAAASWTRKQPLAEANGEKSIWTDIDDENGGERQALVQEIQGLLARLGFDPGPADGLAGPQTRDAVIAYQRQNGVATTGQIDNNLFAALTQGGR